MLFVLAMAPLLIGGPDAAPIPDILSILLKYRLSDNVTMPDGLNWTALVESLALVIGQSASQML